MEEGSMLSPHSLSAVEVLPQQSKNTRQRQSPLITVLSLSQPVALCLRHTHAGGHTHPALAYFQGLPSTWGKRDQNLPLAHTRPS